VRDARQLQDRWLAGEARAGDVLVTRRDGVPAPSPTVAARVAGTVRLDWSRWQVVRPEHGSLDRRRLVPWYVVFAAYAAAFAVLSGGGADRVWALWATGGYTLAAAAAWRSRRLAGPLLAALACGLLAPTIWLILRGPATADPIVVARSAVLLLRHGNPYLSAGQLATWQAYNPYLPAMTVFGLPWAVGLRGVLGDTRLWLAAATVVLLAAAFWTGAPHRADGCGACRRAAAWCAVFAVASPVLALPLAVGITDPPMIALTCLAFACLARSPRLPLAAALAIGVACAMKATAWPALVVIAALLAARDGVRVAARFAAVSLVTTAVLVAVTAPGLLATPAALVQNTVLFPLGLTQHHTPADSPLPGHLLASTGPAGHLAAIVLLLAAGLGIVVWLVVRPPTDVRAAAQRLAIALALMFLLAPATRFGYFAYPVALLGWSAMTGSDRAATGSAGPAGPAVGAAPVPGDGRGAQAQPGPGRREMVRAGVRRYLLPERAAPGRIRRRKAGQNPMTP
jgi:Glycosyltransferase family 87